MSRARAAIFIPLIALPLASCGGSPPAGQARVAVVAVDGATWSVMSPLLEAGRLPRLEALYRAGSAGGLRSVEPLSPGPVWTSVATGKSAVAHGIVSDVVKAPGRYALRPVTADQRRFPAIWTIAGSRGLSVGVTGWAATFPAEEVNGFMIADLRETADERRGTIYPDGALPEGAGPPERADLPAGLRRVLQLDPALASVFERDQSDLSLGLALARVYQPRLVMFRFHSIDFASHKFWQYHDRGLLTVAESRGARVPPERAEELALALPGAYELFDAWVGRLVDGLPEGTTLIILSGYGQRGARAEDTVSVDMNRLLESLGLLAMGEDGTPDWSRTTAFNLPDTRSARRGVWLNLEGRERQGIVSEEAAPAFAARIAAALEDLETTEGVPLFRSVVRSGRRDERAERAEMEPDIQVMENPGIDPMASMRLAGRTVEVRSLYLRSIDSLGLHDETGIILAAGPGIAPRRTGWNASIYDLAPTVLYLLGLPLSPDLPGGPIEEILSAPVPEDHPSVDSFNDLPSGPSPLLLPDDLASAHIDWLKRTGHL